MAERTCIECGAPVPYSGMGAPHKTCGDACRKLRARRWSPKARPRPEVSCSRCKAIFIPVGRGRYTYCPDCQDCGLAGCPNARDEGNWCRMHSRRIQRHGDPGPVHQLPNNPKAGQGWLHKGYRRFKRNGQIVSEHREVMEQIIGRPLYPFEAPHHKNGIRHDNDPGNLELWTKPQPAGQRPEDLVAWVVKFYPELVAAALLANA